MSRFFAFLRQDLRASLIASLLVLGHALLLTAVKAPQESRTDELTSALGTTSALISITILWVTFTILEALDSRLITRWGMRRRSSSSTTSRGGGGGEGEGQRDDEDEEDEVLVFCMTWVELSLGLILLCAWALYIPKAQVIMDAFVAGRSAGLTLIRTSYIIGFLSLFLLQLHLISSIVWQGVRHGGVGNWTFWTGRTGWWVGMGRIKLGEEDRLVVRVGEKV